MNTTGAIIQARMGSTRLPGKVLEDIGGQTMLARVVTRTKRAALISKIIVATTTAAQDDTIVNECHRLQITFFRGKEQDVLDRYYQTAMAYGLDVIVRITADCPLIDPAIIDRVVAAFLAERPDYTSNVINRSYPFGLDVEVISRRALERAWQEAEKPYQRTHVTPFIYENPDLFRIMQVNADSDYSHHRWTVDTPEDLTFVREIYRRLKDTDTMDWNKIIRILASEPELVEINSHICQKPLMEG